MRHILLLLFGCLLAACAPTQQAVAPSPTYQAAPAPIFSAGQASLRLKVGMTESAAIAAIGWQPNSAEVSTCGSETGSPWQCKTLRFGYLGNQLSVIIDIESSPQVVNDWHVLAW
jgi:hypothetical protein